MSLGLLGTYHMQQPPIVPQSSVYLPVAAKIRWMEGEHIQYPEKESDSEATAEVSLSLFLPEQKEVLDGLLVYLPSARSCSHSGCVVTGLAKFAQYMIS